MILDSVALHLSTSLGPQSLLSRLLAPPSVHAPRSLSVFNGVVRNALLSLDLPLFHILLPSSQRPAGSFHFKFGHIFYQRALKVSLIFPEASFPEASRLPDSIASISLATRTKKMALRVAIEIEVETFTEEMIYLFRPE